MNLSPFEAAKILYQKGEKNSAEHVLRKVWSDTERPHGERFQVLCALIEICMLDNPQRARNLIEDIIQGDPDWRNFWYESNLLQQSILFEWHGQLSFVLEDSIGALESLTRSASLGRDTAELWYILGLLHLEREEFELSIRYLKRSLELYRQPGLGLFLLQEGHLGAFVGKHPLNIVPGPKEYLEALLNVVRVCEGASALRLVKELVVEMIHQFPEEKRIPKVRLLLEQSIVRRQMREGLAEL